MAPKVMTDWNAAQYLTFEDERTRPARDLLARIPLDAPQRVIDLGCGPGNSTELLAARWPAAAVEGIDSSPAMVAAAKTRLPGLAFAQADLSSWTPSPPADVLFANAVFHWVPRHLDRLVALTRALPEGGVLAVQMPDNLAEPANVAMREAAATGPWAAKLATSTEARDTLPGVGVYYDRLKPLCARLDIWHTIYGHVLDGAPAIVAWFKSTGLRPFLDPLDESERRAYLEDYEARLIEAYPRRVDGKVILRFPRLFIVAQK